MATEYPAERLDGEISNKYSSSILVAADVLATDIWQDLVEATQSDGIERGLAIARHTRTGKLTRSREYRWHYEFDDEGEEPEAIDNSCQMMLFPLGVVRSVLSPRLREDVYIHTHPIPPALDHLRTNPISDADLRAFFPSRYQAMVMLDRGGAHLVARTRQSDLYGSTPEPDLGSSTMREVIAESGGSMDVMNRLASRLGQYGLAYFYTPELTQAGETVEFQNLRVVSEV